MAKWRIMYQPGMLDDSGPMPRIEKPWWVMHPTEPVVYFAADTCADAVDIAVRSMALLERVTIRDRMR